MLEGFPGTTTQAQGVLTGFEHTAAVKQLKFVPGTPVIVKTEFNLLRQKVPSLEFGERPQTSRSVSPHSMSR